MEDKSLFEQAYSEIRQQILFDVLKPGTKVSWKQLEQQMQIGRTPIREALIQLRKDGLIYAVPQSGTYISKINLKSAANARFVRENIERLIAMECCAGFSKDDKDSLEAILLAQEQAMREQDKHKFFELDNVFHKMFFKIAGKEEVWEWLEVNNVHLDRFRWLRLNLKSIEWEQIIDQHRAILNSIIEQNLEESSFLLSLHLHEMTEEKQSLLDHYPSYFSDGNL
ncbi:DNA-binding transcriptional regulator, GntR family [Amphibacillus marinus]|uniref:DNA-binding transcriptional regulator, GntR family n=1 Tax=Amphibacillus marinus TaxID=872970 RepID=A0A1H8S7X0_9BACI|nr:GntR family transcriptional regulator [Amphibacillus marinus]SEO74702.1 DNA-binding transcriptional regulator, GntR family [Amphibacillus marinus]